MGLGNSEKVVKGANRPPRAELKYPDSVFYTSEQSQGFNLSPRNKNVPIDKVVTIITRFIIVKPFSEQRPKTAKQVKWG